MKNTWSVTAYGALFLAVIVADRVTKSWALEHALERVPCNGMLSFELLLNRGFSWGMLHSANNMMFLGVSLAIVAVMLSLLFYGCVRWMNHYSVIGEVLIFAGAISNVVDRVVYHGVVDFILVSFNAYTFPVFNIADMCIVVGALCMFFMNYNDV